MVGYREFAERVKVEGRVSAMGDPKTMSAGTVQISAEFLDVASLVDLAHYPIDEPGCARYREVIARGRRELAENGALALEGFLSAAGLERLQAEVAELLPEARCRANQESAYGLVPDDDVPEDHPYRIKASQQRHHVARHQMPQAAIDALYHWAPMRRLGADLMGRSEIFVHEDPSNAFVLMVYKQGDHLAWHFDKTDYSLAITIQAAESGGFFEYVPALRSADDECFDDVKKVLMGERSRVVKSRSKPGVFTMIKGNFALHRVTPVEGMAPRVQLVFCYENEPGIKLDVETRKFFYGADAPDDP